jgi:hypothetical protein
MDTERVPHQEFTKVDGKDWRFVDRGMVWRIKGCDSLFFPPEEVMQRAGIPIGFDSFTTIGNVPFFDMARAIRQSVLDNNCRIIACPDIPTRRRVGTNHIHNNELSPR